MIVFPNAKINLGLNIVEKRADGYHNLETLFYPIPWEDALEVNIAKNSGKNKCTLHLSGKIVINDEANDNLVVKAYRLLDADFDLPPVEVYLYKNIPLGAGLGGGSSDAAFMLKMLNDKFNLSLSNKTLEDYAVKLGADCAFFIRNHPVFATEIGNVFSDVTVDLKGYQIVVIKPDVFVSTKEAFAKIKPSRPSVSIMDIVAKPVSEWRGNLFNDFEDSVFPQYPEIREIKETLYNQGAIYASMSGSGSSVYGIFEPGNVIPKTSRDAKHCASTIIMEMKL